MTCPNFPGTEPDVCAVLRLLLDVCIVTCILVFNFFILYSISRYSKRTVLASPYNNSIILITSLCVADISVGFASVYQILPRYLCFFAEYSAHHFAVCIMHSVLVSIGHFSSSFTLVAIAVDRYIAVVYALKYADIMTTRRTFMMITFAWTGGILIATSQFYWNQWRDGVFCETVNFQDKYYELFVLPGVICFTSISLACIYWRIHRIAVTVHNSRRGRELSAIERLHTRSVKTLLLILIFYLIAWLPYIIVTYLKQTGHAVSITIVGVCSSEIKVAYLANPFIYAMNTLRVKECIILAVKSIRMMFRRKNPNEIHIANTAPGVTIISKDSPVSITRSFGLNTNNDT